MSRKRQMTDAEITHLRQLLAWLRVEYMLDEDMQRGALSSVKTLFDSGDISQEEAERLVARRADQIKQVPKYIRHKIKMLTQLVREYDGVKGAIVDVPSREVATIEDSSTGWHTTSDSASGVAHYWEKQKYSRRGSLCGRTTEVKMLLSHHTLSECARCKKALAAKVQS